MIQMRQIKIHDNMKNLKLKSFWIVALTFNKQSTPWISSKRDILHLIVLWVCLKTYLDIRFYWRLCINIVMCNYKCLCFYFAGTVLIILNYIIISVFGWKHIFSVKSYTISTLCQIIIVHTINIILIFSFLKHIPICNCFLL